MKLHAAAMALAAAISLSAQAQTEVQFWHSMVAVNGEWANDLAREFHASQKEYWIVPTFKGSCDKSMTAAEAAFRPGHLTLGDAGCPLEVETVELPGAERLIHARLRDELLTLRTDATTPPPTIGSTVHALPRADRLHGSDSATGHHLEMA